MNGGNVVLRYPTPAKQKDDTYDGEAYVDVTFYGLDNMLKALVHLSLGQEQQVQSLLKFLQINGDGTRFCRYLSTETASVMTLFGKNTLSNHFSQAAREMSGYYKQRAMWEAQLTPNYKS